MKNYLDVWVKDLLQRQSMRLPAPITVMGKGKKHLAAGSDEFAKVQLTVHPASHLEVEDIVPERDELERLGARWPESTVFGLLDVLMFADPAPLFNVRVVLEKAWYHDVDSTVNAFRHAGRDAGRKVLERIALNHSRSAGDDIT